MAEQNQTDIFADFTVTEPSVIKTTPIETIEEKKEDDVFSGFTSTDNVETKKDDVFSGFTITGDSEPTTETLTSVPKQTKKYSNAALIRYGIDKQNTFFGNVYRVAKAGTQAAFDPDKDFKDYIKYNVNQEKLKLKQKYGDLASGAYDDETLVKAAEIATFMTDPFYILAYMTPWGRAATASIKGLAAVSGVTVGLDSMLDQLATTGNIDPKSTAIASGSAAVLGPLSVKAIQGIRKLLPGANEKQLERVIGIVEGKKATDLGISRPEFKKLQKIAGDKEIIELNKQVQKAGKNWIKPIEEQTKLFNAVEKKIESEIGRLRKDTKFAKRKDVKFKFKDKFIKNVDEKIAAKENTLKLKTKEFNTAQKELWKKQSKASQEVTDLLAKREYTFLKKLKDSQSLTQNIAQAVVASSVRPALGGAIGYGFGRLWGGDDANLNNWMLAGATLGGMNKLIQKSGKVFANNEKGFLKNIIYNEATRLSFQKVRELTATTTSTKLKAIGGETEKIGMKLFQELDSPVTKFSASAVADKIKQDYSNRAFKLIANTTADEQNAAVRIARGSKEKASIKVQTLANKVRKYLDDFRNEYTSVGIGLRKDVTKNGVTVGTKRIDPIKDYFPRVWNWSEVKKKPDDFIKTIAQIFKATGNAQQKKDSLKAAKAFYNSLSTQNEQGFYSKGAVNELVTNLLGGNIKKMKTPIIRGLPLSDHIANDRVLKGPYAKVEKILEQKGYLVNDIPSILNNLVSTSANSIGFAKNFGAKGELLIPMFKKVVEKYAGKDNAGTLAANEIGLVLKSIDGFFGRYGQVRQGIVRSGSGVLSTISNLNMLDRVTIASLGDLVQPFTTSNNFTSFIKGLSTSITAKGETGLAKNMGYAQSKEVQNSLLKTLTPLDDATNAANIMGASSTIRKANELGFKFMGLQWLTGFARRYAYNTGAIDAYTSARKLAVYASRNNLTDNKALRLINDVSKYGITTNDALRLGKFKNYNAAISKKFGKDILNSAGIIASNRDALIPQVSNRLLFTQSRDPLVRLMGQFMSWTLAKSAQTNKLLQRIENGDTRQLVKLLAALPVYGGIQSLREIAKYGEIQTDLETQTDKWYSEALRLSGISGTLPELVIGRLSGPGAREPWYLFAPFMSILTDLGDITKEAVVGDTNKAQTIFMEKIAPLPTWRRWIGKLFPGGDFITPVPKSSVNERIGFNKGDVVDENNSNAVVVKQTFLKDAEAEASKKTLVPIKKPSIEEQVNKIVPIKKPNVVVEKTYENVSELEPEKKTWLLDTAKKVYTINKDEIIPSDIILAINSGETGWGTSRFFKEGSNNLFNFQSFNDKEESIAAQNSNAKIKKFDTPEASITQFLDWVQTKPSYEVVRKEIKLYNEGKSSKENIIKAIAKTGFAEDKDWSSKITSILNNRIDGKNRKELKSLADNLFKDTDDTKN